MTRINFYKKNGNIFAYRISGHTNKQEYGSDILCSAISSIAQVGVVGIKEVLKQDCILEIRDGYLYLEVKDYTNKEVQNILKTVEQSLEMVIVGQEKYAKMEVKDDF